MWWLLTGDEFAAEEARRIGLLARAEGDDAAVERLRPEMTRLFGTADAAEGVQSLIERREARFQGR